MFYVGAMERFITEKETEAWLEQETRDITMPDGSTRPITHFKLMWNGFDFLTATPYYQPKPYYTEARLVEWAVMDAEGTGRSFEETFPGVVTYVYKALRKHLGIDP